jgi:hypothetical protein
MASEGTIPLFKGALVELTLWWLLLTAWVFITKITEEFILGLDVLHAHNEAIDLYREMNMVVP